MVKMEKNNIILTVSEEEIAYYKQQGFKKAGEKETVEKTVSLSKYNKLAEEMKNVKAKVDSLEKEKEELEKSLNESQQKVDSLEKEINELKSNGGK